MKKEDQLSQIDLKEEAFNATKYDRLHKQDRHLANHLMQNELNNLNKQRHERIEATKKLAEETKAREIEQIKQELEETKAKLKEKERDQNAR